MLQLLKDTPARLFAAALKPQRTMLNLRYRFMARSIAANAPRGVRLSATDENLRKISFTFAIIALSARVAQAGGLSREKYAAFREVFPLKGHLCTKIRSLFALACEDEVPLEHYLLQIQCAFPGRRDLFGSIVDRLFSIAAADGSVSRAAEQLLGTIARSFDLSASDYADISAKHIDAQPHERLGIDKHVEAGALKKHYRDLMRRWHPDRFAAENLSPELELLLKLKSADINQAYSLLAKKVA